MKRKGLKILCGVLATLSVLGATSTIVGALSDGFKNWDTSTWFDKGTSEPVTKEDLVTTPDESLPVKMSVRYLTDDTAIKKANNYKPMNGIEITATCEGASIDAYKFSFSSDDSSLFNYEINNNVCTLNFLKKSLSKFSVFCSAMVNSEIKRGVLNIDFIKSPLEYFRPDAANAVENSLFLEGRNLYIKNCLLKGKHYFDLIPAENYDGTVSDQYDISFIGTSQPGMSSGSHILWDGNFVKSFITVSENKLLVDFDKVDLLSYVSNGKFDSYRGKRVYIANFDFKCVSKTSKKNTDIDLTIDLLVPTITDGGVDMGGDIVVG